MKKNIFLIILVLSLGYFDAVFAMKSHPKYTKEELLGLRGSGSPLPLETIETMRAVFLGKEQ
jgi:hypothetical protein